MPLQKLSPLQPQPGGSCMASIALLMLYLTFLFPQSAYGVDVDSTRHEDHNHDRLVDGAFLNDDYEQLQLREAGGYEGNFFGYDRSIIGRVPAANSPEVLLNNRPSTSNLVQGGLNSYSFLSASVLAAPGDCSVNYYPSIGRRHTSQSHDEVENTAEVAEDLELRMETRQSTRTTGTVYISVNVCIQPTAIQNTTVEPPPQIQLYVSLSDDNPNPGPTQNSNSQQMILLEGGATMLQVNATGDIFFGLYGENTTAYTGVWNAQVAASIDCYYHTYVNESDSNLYLVDSDSSSALLITGNLTDVNSSDPLYQIFMDTPPYYTILAINQDDPSIYGLQNSYCGLNQFSTIAPTANRSADSVTTGITNWGNGQPRQQFYVDNLTKGSTYNIALALAGNASEGSNVAGGGGKLWSMTKFTTLSDGNCAVIYDLSFCTQTAYAVPSNPNNFPNTSSLAAFYDNSTQAMYQFFQNVLAQIPCETTSSAQYSLARHCNDCATSYQDWLCSVSIPRCTDWSSTYPWLQGRNMVRPFPNGTSLSAAEISFAQTTLFLNSSRNPNIDQAVQPGPYKEILPCDDLCYGIVQSCPAAMGFNCPRPNQGAFNQSYGLMPDGSPEQSGQITCNYPGAAFNLASIGSSMTASYIIMTVALAVAILVHL